MGAFGFDSNGELLINGSKGYTTTGEIVANDTTVSVTSGTFLSSVANLITVTFIVPAGHTVQAGDIIKVSGITNVVYSTSGSSVVMNGYHKVDGIAPTVISFTIDVLTATFGSTALTGTVSFTHGGLYLDSIPKVKSGANYYPIQGATAWVNFNGTTTPPTIRDSFNVSAVVRTSTGIFDIYFKEPMDNVNYVVNGNVGEIGNADVTAYQVKINNKFTYKLIIVTNAVNATANILDDFVMTDIQIFGGKN